MKKYITGFVAVMLGLFLAVGTTAFKDIKAPHKSNSDTQFYFQFTGSHGNESNTSLWQQISATDYDNLDCPGANAGCKIITSSATGMAPNVHPSSVPVDANSKPTVTGTTLEAAYRN